MKKQQNPSQYRPFRQSTALAQDLLEELKVLKALETHETQPTPQA
jgi:hypothetical protein